eukprot:3716407-Rhodomonas_salina.1
MAERIIRSGKLTEDPMQLEVRGPICYAKSGIGLGRRVGVAGASLALVVLNSGTVQNSCGTKLWYETVVVGWASLVPALFFTGEFEVMFIYQ